MHPGPLLQAWVVDGEQKVKWSFTVLWSLILRLVIGACFI